MVCYPLTCLVGPRSHPHRLRTDAGDRPALCVTSVVWKERLDLPRPLFLVDNDGMGRKFLLEDNMTQHLTIYFNSLLRK